jgi:chromosome partitioning protein
VSDPSELRYLRSLGYDHVFVDTPGSAHKASSGLLLAAMTHADDALVPITPAPMSHRQTVLTISQIIKPLGLPYQVVINDWAPGSGRRDLDQTKEVAVLHGWPLCAVEVRHYMAHQRACVDGWFPQTYPAEYSGAKARRDIQLLAMSLGYHLTTHGQTRVHVLANMKGGVGKTTLAVTLSAYVAEMILNPASILTPPTTEGLIYQ